MSTLPGSIRCAADELLNELEASCLQVVLVPEKRRTCECGMIRVAVSKNAKWYRDFCATYLSSRRRRNQALDTAIRRQHTVRALRLMVEGQFRESGYFARLYPVCQQRAKAMARREALAS